MERRKAISMNYGLAAMLVFFALLAGQILAQSSSQQAPAGQQSAAGPPSQAAPSQPASSPSSPGAPAPAQQAQPSPAEAQAFQAMQKEPDPTKQIQLVKDFEKQFPDSPLLSDVYFFGALASWTGHDIPGAITYCQASLKLQPNNLRSLILVSGILPLPQALQGTTDQKEQQLTAAEDDGNHALQMLAALQAPSTTPPDQFDRAKKMFEAEVHAGLGMAHLEKAVIAPGSSDTTELTAAEQEYKAAVASPQPVSQDYFRLGEVYARENKLDDAISAFTQAAQLGPDQMKQLANQMIDKLKAQQAKTGATPQSPPPAKPN